MVHKRPFIEEDVFEVSCKQPRQTEHSNQWVFIFRNSFPENAALFSNASGEGRFTNVNTKCNENLANAIDAKHQGNAEDFVGSVPGCIAESSLGTCTNHEEDTWTEEPLHIPSYAECFIPERPERTVTRLEDIYSLLMQYPSRKTVLVGPNYQADIPECDSQVASNTSNHDVSETGAGRYENELMGTCIISMPALESSAYDDKVGSGRTNCSCEDKDSVRCVRQHILETREQLRKSLGHERFMELGFCDMGEVVAEKWSEHEELLFHKVVFSNPASLGRKFWDSLAYVFPFRTKADIVSYYFNVFILRKRSEQNRCESMSINSDNDEWQGTDDTGNNEAEFSDEDDESVVKSPVCQEDFAHHQNKKNSLCAFEEDIAYKTCDNHSLGLASGADAIKVSEIYSGNLLSNRASDLIAQVHENTLKDERGVQDYSCTSFDAGSGSQETQTHADNCNGLKNGGSHGIFSEPCDLNVWDTRYPTCQSNKMNLLPTYSMIEEDLRDES